MTAFNFCTMTEYSGKNATLEGNGIISAFATFNQLKTNGYMVKKGAKGVGIHCGFRKVEDKASGKVKSVPRYATVFDICDTTAQDDKDYMKWLESEIAAGRVKKAGTE